jgi:hypothetical protein
MARTLKNIKDSIYDNSPHSDTVYKIAGLTFSVYTVAVLWYHKTRICDKAVSVWSKYVSKSDSDDNLDDISGDDLDAISDDNVDGTLDGTVDGTLDDHVKTDTNGNRTCEL